ncbi:MAG: hypothetical protein ABEI31_01565 [Halodesulfurarchaeum sp.]
MSAGMGTLDWIGLVVPFVVYLIMLVVYYVWEGRREEQLKQQFSEEMNNG